MPGPCEQIDISGLVNQEKLAPQALESSYRWLSKCPEERNEISNEMLN
jgi:hypothetical protein